MSNRLLQRARYPVWPGFLPHAQTRAGIVVTAAYTKLVAEDDDNHRLIELQVAGASRAFFGTSAPADDTASLYMHPGVLLRRILPAGMAVYLKGAEATTGSYETWTQVEANHPLIGD